MRDLKQSTPEPVRLFLTLASDHVTGATGKTLTVTLAKPGAGFAAAAGAVTERGHGWYDYTPTAGEVDTLGELAIHATAADCDPADRAVLVVTATAADAYAGTAAAIAALATTDLLVVARWEPPITAAYTGDLLDGAEIRVLAGNFYLAGSPPSATLDTLGPSAYTAALGTLAAAGWTAAPGFTYEDRDALIVTVYPGVSGSTTAGTLTLAVIDGSGHPLTIAVELPACAPGYIYGGAIGHDGAFRVQGDTRWGWRRLSHGVTALPTPATYAYSDTFAGEAGPLSTHVADTGERYAIVPDGADMGIDGTGNLVFAIPDQSATVQLLDRGDMPPEGVLTATLHVVGDPYVYVSILRGTPGNHYRLFFGTRDLIFYRDELQQGANFAYTGNPWANGDIIEWALTAAGHHTISVNAVEVFSWVDPAPLAVAGLGIMGYADLGLFGFSSLSFSGPGVSLAQLLTARPTLAQIEASALLAKEATVAALGAPADVATAVWAHLIEAGYSAEELMRLAISILCGLVSGSGSDTLSFRDLADTKPRVTLTVDGQGNRTGVVLDAS